jgi:hypothetical protein
MGDQGGCAAPFTVSHECGQDPVGVVEPVGGHETHGRPCQHESLLSEDGTAGKDAIEQRPRWGRCAGASKGSDRQMDSHEVPPSARGCVLVRVLPDPIPRSRRPARQQTRVREKLGFQHEFDVGTWAAHHRKRSLEHVGRLDEVTDDPERPPGEEGRLRALTYIDRRHAIGEQLSGFRIPSLGEVCESQLDHERTAHRARWRLGQRANQVLTSGVRSAALHGKPSCLLEGDSAVRIANWMRSQEVESHPVRCRPLSGEDGSCLSMRERAFVLAHAVFDCRAKDRVGEVQLPLGRKD